MSVDVKALDPATFARHLGNPKGKTGISIATSLNAMNAKVHSFAYRAIGLSPNGRIFEVGFGNGHLIPELLALPEGSSYAGLDISETMVNEAAAFNADSFPEGGWTSGSAPAPRYRMATPASIARLRSTRCTSGPTHRLI